MATQSKFLCAILTLLAALTLPASFPSAAQSEKSQTPSLGDQLVTRTYKLDTEKIQRLDTTILNKPPGQRRPSDILRALLEHERIQIPATSTNTTPSATAATARPNQKSFHFNEAPGELTLRASRRDIPKFEKYLSQIAAAAPPVDNETFGAQFPTRIHYTSTVQGRTNWIFVPVLRSNQPPGVWLPLPTNSFTYTMPPKSTVIRLLNGEELLPKNSSSINPILPGDKSLFIRGDSQ